MSNQQSTQDNDIFSHIQSQPSISHHDNADLDFIMDIPVNLTVELGQTRVAIKELLDLTPGSVIELGASVGTPLNILINGCLIAAGEVVIIDNKYGIRLTDIKSPSERIQNLAR